MHQIIEFVFVLSSVFNVINAQFGLSQSANLGGVGDSSGLSSGAD
jgi:hypothetical protein